ncbi:MAG: VWA domain-containing protein, partial [Caldilinea sp.]
MARFFIGILILVLVGSAVVAGVWYFGERTIETGNLARQVPAPVAWIQEPITITTRINLLPYSSCTQGTTPVDMVVLIDISASMVGAPIEQAVAGAQRLLDTLEFSKDQVAVALFNSDVVGRVGLTEDRQALTSLLRGAIANDGTNLMAALNYAQSELVSLRRRYDALPVVLLFSDGGDVNESGVAGLAQQIKQNGAQVFVIGLQGEDFNQPLLTAVASDTDSLRIAPSPQDLVAMFEAIAQTVNRYAISNFDYREPIATDNFAIVASTLSAGATVAGNDLRLHADVLTQEETQTLGGIQYQLIPQQYGYHAVTSDNALMALTTCEAERVQHSLPPGPSILVLPPMPFTFGLPLLLLLLAGLPLLFRRQKQSATPARGGSSGIGHTQPATPLPLESFTHWLDRSDSLDPEAGRNLAASMTTTPTLIVGLGATGKTVLAQISRNLSERLGTQWPQNIRLLQISLPEKLEKGGAEPLPDQVTAVVLERDTTRLNLAQPHLRWAKQYADGVRQRGRLALFADLSDGKVNSFLWQALDRAIGDQEGVVVWIVTDAFSPASGMIVDVAHLLHVRARAGILASMRLCLAMQNTHWPGGTNTHILAKRAFATIRELRRVRRVRG